MRRSPKDYRGFESLPLRKKHACKMHSKKELTDGGSRVLLALNGEAINVATLPFRIKDTKW